MRTPSKKYTKKQISEVIAWKNQIDIPLYKALRYLNSNVKVNESKTSASLPIVDLGDVLRLDGCQKQEDMCWGYEGFVLVHKSVNPDFDRQKPYVVVMRQDDVPRMEDFWQLHFVNFGMLPKNPSVLDSLYKALAISCETGMDLYLAGYCTPGGISAFNKLKDYGFKKKWLPYGFSIEWEYGNGSDLDQDKLEKWLKSGKHDDEFLVVRWDPELRRWVETRASKFSPEELKNIKVDDTKPRPFKMVRNQTVVKEDRKMKKRYTKKQITEAIAYWKKQLKAGNYERVDESESKTEFEVKATSDDGTEIEETVDAKDLYELVSFMKEDFARESGVDIDDVRFSFDEVIDENGNDVTRNANACIDFK